jgi:hypothetical protein
MKKSHMAGPQSNGTRVGGSEQRRRGLAFGRFYRTGFAANEDWRKWALVAFQAGADVLIIG